MTTYMDKLRLQKEATMKGTTIDQLLLKSDQESQSTTSSGDLPAGSSQWSYLEKVQYRKTGRVPKGHRDSSTHIDKIKRQNYTTVEPKTYMDKLKAKQLMQ